MDNKKLPARTTSTGPGAGAGRFIVVFGTKGGVGKTMVAANLAVSLAQRLREPVCLVDLDTMGVGDVCKMLNLAPARAVVELMPALKREGSLDRLPLDGVVAPHSSRVHVLTCVANPRQAAQLDPHGLTKLWQALKTRYDYVLVDAGRVLSDALLAAMDAANLILLVATPDVLALYQTKWALGLVESLLFPPSMVKVILNRADSLGSVDPKDVRAALSCEILGEIPSDGRIVGTAINQGIPIVTGFGYSKVAEAFFRLATILTGRDELYIAHQDIPRHRRTTASGAGEQSERSPLPPSPLSLPQEPTAAAEAVDDIVLVKRRIHERLLQELDLKKLDLTTLTSNTEISKLRHKVEPLVAALLAREMGGLISSHEVRARLVKEIVDEAIGLGPLEELLADGEVTDILVNNQDQIYVERRGKLELTAKKFISNEQVLAVIERIVAPLGRRIDESNPMVDARLPDGSRVNAIIPPLSLKGPTLSIRKFARSRYTVGDLIQFGSLSPAMAEFIKCCVLSRRNLIISGGTGSGKTTLLNVVSAFIPEDERIVTIEDAAELKLAQRHWVSLEARPPNIEGKGQIAIRDLFRNALRMRPDRILIGECRGAETLDMLQAMNTGHDGSITTVHANSPKDVISRLDSMVLMSNVDLPVRAIREMTASAIDVVIHTARLSDGSRKITAITELTDLTHDIEIVFRDLFLFRQTGLAPDGTVLGDYVATGTRPTFWQELRMKGIELDASIFSAPSGSAAPAAPPDATRP